MEEKRPGEFFPVEEDARGTYLYNSKDMCMIGHVPELIAAGIDSFKIEGRNKTAYYAACVTGAYRAAIDSYQAAPEEFALPSFCMEEVSKVSHREYYTGFYFGSAENGQHYGDSQYIREYEVVGMPVCCEAVSYTHLDVYKRQVQDIETDRGGGAENTVDRIQLDHALRADKLAAAVLQAGSQHIQVDQAGVRLHGDGGAGRGRQMDKGKNRIERNGDQKPAQDRNDTRGENARFIG